MCTSLVIMDVILNSEIYKKKKKLKIVQDKQRQSEVSDLGQGQQWYRVKHVFRVVHLLYH